MTPEQRKRADNALDDLAYLATKSCACGDDFKIVEDCEKTIRQCLEEPQVPSTVIEQVAEALKELICYGGSAEERQLKTGALSLLAPYLAQYEGEKE